MRNCIIKLVLLLSFLFAWNAMAWFPEHVWAVGPATNCYGLAQWDEYLETHRDSDRGRKRTVLYFGSHQWIVHQPAALVGGIGAFGIVSLALMSVLAGSRIGRQHRYESRVSYALRLR